MALLSIDIARLIHHHLLKEGYEKSANHLISECPHLKGLKPVQPPYKLPRLLGPSLADLLESYFETKEYVIEELDLLESAIFREHDSLPSLTKTLFQNVKSETATVSKPPKETCDASVNTEHLESDSLCQPSAEKPQIKETCDASVNTENTFDDEEKKDSLKLQNQNAIPPKETCDASVNTDWGLSQVLDFGEKDSSPNSSEPPMSEREETIDFALVYDRLLEDRDFQEKIAENINKKKALVSFPDDDTCKSGNFATAQDLDAVIKAIVAETQADPAFDNFLKDCIGTDSLDPTPVGTPDSTAQIEGEPIASPAVSHVEENQENALAVYNAGMPPVAVDPSAMPTFCTIQGSEIICNSSSINSLNSVAIVTSSGQITFVPTIVSAVPCDATVPTNAVLPSVPTKKTRKKAQAIIKRAPVAIAPKPVFTLTIPAPESSSQVSDAVSSAVSEAVSEYVEEFRVSDFSENQQSSVGSQIVTSSPAPSQPKPMKKLKSHQPLRKKARRNWRTDGKIVETPQNPAKSIAKPSSAGATPQITSAMAELLKIAQEACKTMNIPNEEPPAEAEVSQSPEVVFTTPTPDASGFVTTPTSTRRRSHVRQLNFGESPEVPAVTDKSAEKSSTVQTKRSEIPWDLALRNAVATSSTANPPPSDDQIFATPKGKAKRARKHSPPPMTEAVNETTANDPGNVADSSTSTCSTTSEPIISSTPFEKTAKNVAQQTPHLCATTDTTYADLVAASILNEMANTPMKEITTVEVAKEQTEERIVELSIPEPEGQVSSLSCFGMSFLNREETVTQQQQPALPVLATPRKEADEIVANSLIDLAAHCDGQNSTSFGAWDGEIPRTPQIRLDLTSSTSPFQVSLTKGFRFLPAADSPSLAVPATPCIFEANSTNNSIETPYTGFYQFPSVLNTPRLEALRQEVMESPGKNMTITMISPTQVVLGRSTPYFVPSGERAQGPIINQNATPEHVPEPDKLERRLRRRSSTEMDPLQLEESNDASDAAAALMCRAAENVAAALKPSTPYKTDQTLENDLINECMRLDAPSVEKTVQLQKRYIDLFGEDSNNPNEPTTVSSHAGLMPSTPKTTKEKTRKPRRTALNASNSANSPANSGCARAQGYSASPKSDRRKSQRRSNSKNQTEEEEDIIQEVLAMAKASTKGVSETQKKRKHRSESTNREKNAPAHQTQSEKDAEPKRLTFHDSNDNISEDYMSTDKTESPRVPSPTSSNQDIDVVEIAEPVANIPKKRKSSKTPKEPVEDIVKPASNSPQKSRKTNKAPKEAGKRSAIAKPYSTAASSFESRKTPVKLFKSSITSPASFQSFPFRKAVSYRQSAGAKKSPHKVRPNITDGSNSEQLPETEPVGQQNDQVNTSAIDDSVEPVLMESASTPAETAPEAAAMSNGLVNLAIAAQTLDEGVVAAESINAVTNNISNNNSTSETDFTLQLEEVPSPPINLAAVASCPVVTNSPVSSGITAEEAASHPPQQDQSPPILNVPSAAPSVTNNIVIPPSSTKEKTPHSPQAASKEKSRRSISKHQTYLKMSSLSTVSPQIGPAVSSVATQPNNIPQPKTPASISRQRAKPTQKEAIVIHKDLVNKIRKELRLSKEFDIYSQ